MALYCPVTGLKVLTGPDWINQEASNTFAANFWIINDSVIYSLPKGHADLEGVRNSLSLNEKVASFVSDGNGPFVQIEDYTFLASSRSDSRRYFTNKMNNDKRRSSLIFCNLSQPLSIAVKIGKRFNTTGKYIHVARHYSDAIKRALELGDRNQRKPDIAPIDLYNCFGKTNRYLSPVELLSEDSWDIRTPEFSNRMVFIDQCILHSTSEGYLESKHIPFLEHTRSLCQSDTAEDSKIKYIVVDSSRLKAGSRSARALYMQSLKRWHQRFPLRMYIVYGANTFMKTALHLAMPLMPFKVKIAKDIGHAFHLIRDDRSRSHFKKHAIRADAKPTVVINDDIEKIMAFIGSINWAQEGIETSFHVGEDQPLYFLYQSIKLIKEELDDLFKERDQFEEQLHQSRKMESIGTLAGGIAHDFNNILSIIIGNTEIALENIPNSNPAHANLEKIKSAGLRAAGVVKQLLNFSRKTVGELRPIEAITVIKDALDFLRSTIPSSIEIHRILPARDVTILADPIQINQVMMNICTNASQAMAETGGILEIKVEKRVLTKGPAQKYPDLSAGQYLAIMVRDTGKGIDADIVDRVFDPYFTTKEVGKGSGMGLAVVHGIVKDHGGAITVDSKPGKGTTFTILFPVVVAKPETEVKAPGEIPGGNESILFVDDEAPIVNMAGQMLKRLGYTVETKMNSEEAFVLFQENPEQFDLVITDMTMPRMSGVELSERLKKVRSDIPVIVCTGYSDLIDEEKAKDLDISAFLMKPIVKINIARTIRNVLNEAKSLTSD